MEASAFRRALGEIADLEKHAEHTSASPSLLASLGIEVGQQLRVRRDGGHAALFTVSEARDERPENIVRMGLGGRERLGASPGDGALVSPRVVNGDLCDADARTQNEFVERLDNADVGRQRPLIVIAPHGGEIEAHTDDQAERVGCALGARAPSVCRCRGYGNADAGAHQRWHITSTDLHPASFPLLRTVSSHRYSHAIAFHGFTPRDGTDVLIGGLDTPVLKQRLRQAILHVVDGALDVRIAGPADRFGGDDPANMSTGPRRPAGVACRSNSRSRHGPAHWAAIADAVASVYQLHRDR